MREIPIQAGRQAERGQAILEFAMIVPMLFLMLVGVAYFAMASISSKCSMARCIEGTRVWARNPAGGSVLNCSLPKCTPSDDGKAENNFVEYIKPVIRDYVTSHGFDGSKVIFYAAKRLRMTRPIREALWRMPKTSIKRLKMSAVIRKR